MASRPSRVLGYARRAVIVAASVNQQDNPHHQAQSQNLRFPLIYIVALHAPPICAVAQDLFDAAFYLPIAVDLFGAPNLVVGCPAPRRG